MISSFWYILIGIPITVFVYLPYVAFLEMRYLEYAGLLGILYILLAFELTADPAFRNNCILMLLNAVGASGRAIIYLFVAITLIMGPIYDIHINILHLVQETKQDTNPTDFEKISKFKHNLYHVIDTHIENHLLRSVKPLCQVADNWAQYHSGKTSDICGSFTTRTHKSITSQNSYERFLYDFFNFGTFYKIQRVLVFCLFVMCTIYLTKVSSRYREDMSFKNIFVTSTVAKLDKQAREPTIDIEHGENGDEEEKEPRFKEQEPPAKRVFKRTLPLTTLERRNFVLVDHYKYLGSELHYMWTRFLKLMWILFLCAFIYYFDSSICYFLAEEYPDSKVSISTEKQIRQNIAAAYLMIALLFILIEPIATRLHHKHLEVFYPDVAKRRALILMQIIKLQRKSYIKINRLNIYLRFNKVGNLWTAIRSFVEDSSLGDCLGRPSGLFCNICEKEAKIPKNAQRCSTYSCPCVYCNVCYEQIRHICLYCNKKYDETMVVHIHPHTENNATF